MHEEVDDLVAVVHLVEHDEFPLSATRSFHLIFENFVGHDQLGSRVFLSLLDSQRVSALFVASGVSLSFF